MLNKLSSALRDGKLVCRGDAVICAVSGGADSIALLFGLYLLKDRFGFTLSAAHFNHHLRGAESDADEAFVRDFCARYDIPLHVGGADVKPGAKGLEAAAREERYAFLKSLPGKIATAHTADDNAETVLMHLLRGTGLKGLGGIMPVNGNVIRPMLNITRQDVEEFLESYYLPHREDSSNSTDAFLRNRIRHGIMPLLRQENPMFSTSVSAMAQRLREDEACLQEQLQPDLPSVSVLRSLHPALRMRYLERFLKASGIPEPEQTHLMAAENLVFSEKPSASANFPGGKVIARNYDRLELRRSDARPSAQEIAPEGTTVLPQWGIRVICRKDAGDYGIIPAGAITVRSRQAGDSLRLAGGTKSLKKLMIDRKISAADRPFIPVLADDAGVIYVPGIGMNLDRISNNPNIFIRIMQESETGGKKNGE